MRKITLNFPSAQKTSNFRVDDSSLLTTKEKNYWYVLRTKKLTKNHADSSLLLEKWLTCKGNKKLLIFVQQWQRKHKFTLPEETKTKNLQWSGARHSDKLKNGNLLKWRRKLSDRSTLDSSHAVSAAYKLYTCFWNWNIPINECIHGLTYEFSRLRSYLLCFVKRWLKDLVFFEFAN